MSHAEFRAIYSPRGYQLSTGKRQVAEKLQKAKANLDYSEQWT